MKQRIFVMAIVLLVVFFGGGFYLYNTGNLPMVDAANDAYVVSGFIESDQINVTSEVSGRVVALGADEGETIKAGQTLVQLDRT